MVYLGYILPPKNQKEYNDDVALALANYQKDLINAKFEKMEPAGDQALIQNMLTKIEEKKVINDSSPKVKVLNAENYANLLAIQNAKKTVNDLIDMSEVKTKSSPPNTDLKGMTGNNFLNELKGKITSENKGLKKPQFKENLITDNVPVNTLMQELKLKLQKPNKGLKEKLNEAKVVVQDMVDTQNITRDVLEKVVDKVVKDSKDSIFESFNKTLTDVPTIDSFSDAHTYASSTINDFDEQYLRWNKDENIYNKILQDSMQKQNITKIKIFNNKGVSNKNFSTIEFKDGIAYYNKSGNKTKLNERQLFYTLLYATSEGKGKILGEGIRGKGMSAVNGEKNFGEFHLSLPALRKGNLVIYRPKSNSVLITRRNMSPTLTKIINDVKSTMKFDLNDYDRLKVMEQKVVDHVINLLRMDYPPKMKRALDEENWNLKQRYEILLSEINAGNGGYMVVSELKDVLGKLKENKVINNRKYKLIISALE